MTHEKIDPKRPNDPLREVLPMEAWPPGQPPVTPLSQWPTRSDRGWYWKPELLRGYVPILKRLSLVVRDAAGEFSAVPAGRIHFAFLDPGQDDTPSQNQEFSSVPAGLVAPTSAETIFFAAAATVGIVNATNDGAGYEFPARTPMRYYGIWVSYMGNIAGGFVQVTPVIHYVRKGVGQGG